jgi:hypothetical protein
VQALAGQWLLGRAGLPATLELGVARAGDGIEAHAWLASDGRVILGGDEAGRFSPMRARAAD